MKRRELVKLALERKPSVVAADHYPCHPLQSICSLRLSS